MANFALIFRFRSIIEGPSFQAGVHVEGRVLLTQEASDGGEWWAYGVNPGAMAAHGETPEAAYKAFWNYFKDVVTDLAAESNGHVELGEKVRHFMLDVDRVEATRWETARQARREGAVSTEGFSKAPEVLEAGEPRLIECVALKDGKVVIPAPAAPAPTITAAKLKEAYTAPISQAADQELATAA
jgi:hypothetical protein